MPRVGAAVLRARHIRGMIGLYSVGSKVFSVAGRVWLSPVDVPWTVVIDRIIYHVGSTSAGNVRVGLYREGATADSPVGAALVVESESIAQSGASYIQIVTVTDTLIVPGQYFFGIQGSNTTGTFYKSDDAAALLGKYYDLGEGYGAFTNPCPTLGGSGTMPWFMLRVKTNLPAGYRL